MQATCKLHDLLYSEINKSNDNEAFDKIEYFLLNMLNVAEQNLSISVSTNSSFNSALVIFLCNFSLKFLQRNSIKCNKNIYK